MIDAPVRKRIPKKDPFGCEKRSRKAPKLLKKILIWILVLNLLPLGVEMIQEGIGQTAREAVPEPVLSPQAEKLWQGEDITVWADWGSAAGDHMSIPILLENNSREEVTASARNILLKDFQTTYTYLYVDAYKESWGRGYLYLDEDDLEFAGEGPFREVRFDLEIYDSESFETLYEITDLSVTLEQPLPGKEPPEGLFLLDREDISARFLGYEQQYGDQWKFQILLENKTDRELSFWSEDTSLDGQAADISFWAELPAGTRGVMQGYYSTEEPMDPAVLEMTLIVFDGETYESLETPEPFVISLK